MKLAKTHDYCGSTKPRLTAVMIHGIAADSSDYSATLEYLEGLDVLKDVRLVTFDLLGSGKSLKDDKLNYDYNDQLKALNNAITDLKIDGPLVLVGHSLGTFIATKYTDQFKNKVDKLILISPPIYTRVDFDNPAFEEGIKAFKKLVSLKDPKILEKKSFINSMNNIVLNRDNYDVLAGLDIPTILIYGEGDQLIASFNIPQLLKKNSSISAIKTSGKHGISRDKYDELAKILEEAINDIS